LKNFKSCFYDPVILDIKMPQMNGFLVYREIKKLDERIKVCFLTAGERYYGIYTDLFSSVDVKCFIRKPIENEELIKRIHEIITTN
jgi:DNA-binding response OmpR family regulator